MGLTGATRPPTPRSFCVNTVDKGVTDEIGVKTEDKGLSAVSGACLDFA